MNFSSSVMSGMGISLGSLEMVTDFLYANSDMYEPELTEIKATISHKPCKPVNRVKPIKPKASKEVIVRKFDLVSGNRAKSLNNYDEIIDDGSIMVEQSDDFDFSFDDMKTKEEIKQEQSEESAAMANDLLSRLNNFGKQSSVEEDDDIEFDIDDDSLIDPEDDYALDEEDEYEDNTQEDDDEDDDIDLEELAKISDKKLQEHREQQMTQANNVQTSTIEEDDTDDEFEFDLGEDEEDEEGDDEEDEDTDEFELDIDEEDEDTKETPVLNNNQTVTNKVNNDIAFDTDDEEDESEDADTDEDDDFEFDLGDDTDDEEDTDSDDGDIEFDLDEDDIQLPAYEDKTKQNKSVTEQTKNENSQRKVEQQTTKSVENKQFREAITNQPTDKELEMSMRIKQLEEQVQELSRLQAPVQTSNVVNECVKKDSNFKNVASRQSVPQHTETKTTEPNYDKYTAMQIDVLYKEVRAFIIKMGVHEKLVDINELNNKFGAMNIKKLINKSYIIRIGKGVTIGR